MTLHDALESQYVRRERARPYLEQPSPERYSSTEMGSSQGLSTKQTERCLPRSSISAPLVPSLSGRIAGPFSVIVVAGEKCTFRRHCKRQNCVVRFGKWQVRSWPFDCELFYKSGDYLSMGER